MSRVSGQVVGQLAGRRDQCFLAARRDRQDGRAAGRGGVVRGRDAVRGGRFGEHDVGVGAAESERVDPGDASLAVGKRRGPFEARRS